MPEVKKPKTAQELIELARSKANGPEPIESIAKAGPLPAITSSDPPPEDHPTIEEVVYHAQERCRKHAEYGNDALTPAGLISAGILVPQKLHSIGGNSMTISVAGVKGAFEVPFSLDGTTMLWQMEILMAHFAAERGGMVQWHLSYGDIADALLPKMRCIPYYICNAGINYNRISPMVCFVTFRRELYDEEIEEDEGVPKWVFSLFENDPGNIPASVEHVSLRTLLAWGFLEPGCFLVSDNAAVKGVLEANGRIRVGKEWTSFETTAPQEFMKINGINAYKYAAWRRVSVTLHGKTFSLHRLKELLVDDENVKPWEREDEERPVGGDDEEVDLATETEADEGDEEEEECEEETEGAGAEDAEATETEGEEEEEAVLDTKKKPSPSLRHHSKKKKSATKSSAKGSKHGVDPPIAYARGGDQTTFEDLMRVNLITEGDIVFLGNNVEAGYGTVTADAEIRIEKDGEIISCTSDAPKRFRMHIAPGWHQNQPSWRDVYVQRHDDGGVRQLKELRNAYDSKKKVSKLPPPLKFATVPTILGKEAAAISPPPADAAIASGSGLNRKRQHAAPEPTPKLSKRMRHMEEAVVSAHPRTLLTDMQSIVRQFEEGLDAKDAEIARLENELEGMKKELTSLKKIDPLKEQFAKSFGEMDALKKQFEESFGVKMPSLS